LINKITLTLLVQEIDVVKALAKLDTTLDIFIEIDAGYHRSGVLFNNYELINTLIDEIQRAHHSFKGFYCHAGNSYNASGIEEITSVYEDVSTKLKNLKAQFKQYNPHIAYGDTPTCSVIDVFEGIDSIHPGNFVYYDYTQVQIGSCTIKEVATFLLCPIVGLQKNRNEIIVYGGGVHLSKESIELNGNRHFGLVGYLNEDGSFTPYKSSFVKSISQEHGIISVHAETISKLKVSDIVAILPIHSCMTVDCMFNIYTEKGELISKMRQ